MLKNITSITANSIIVHNRELKWLRNKNNYKGTCGYEASGG